MALHGWRAAVCPSPGSGGRGEMPPLPLGGGEGEGRRAWMIGAQDGQMDTLFIGRVA